MTFQQAQQKLKGVPYISVNNAKSLYNFIIKNRTIYILELGIAHGTASCYMAAALQKIGRGKITCVDLLEVRNNFKPSAEDQLSTLGLTDFAEIHRMESGYNWFLHDEIKRNSESVDQVCKPKYDLIVVDGPKNWTIDSSSFFLCDKLLKENGWIIWDDYQWTYSRANNRKDATDGISHSGLSEDELKTPHIKEIFELLVMQHPNYGNFIIQEDSDWVWAQKLKSNSVKSIIFKHSHSITYYIIRKMRKLLRK